MENSMIVPQKIKNKVTVWSSNSTLGIFPKESKSEIQRDVCTLVFIAASFTRAKMGKQLKCPQVDEWIKKM